jgi:hypothetical protein
MKKYFLIILLFTQMSLTVQAQEHYQTVRGEVVDAVTDFPLTGASIILQGTNPPVGTTTDGNGHFELNNVLVGRQGIEVRFIGYQPSVLSNLLVTSGKELVLQIKLEESYQRVDEITVKASGEKSVPRNEMAMISARSFSVEETERFAGSLGDPARMVANYAGVMTQNDSRNDIIIRGNSPIGVLWRLEGIEIPNPNHFGALGTTGGPVSILNNNLLTNSDFFTGAFPAEYGNATSGVFDLYMRSGNNSKTEFTGQIGASGFEAGVEGPFGKKGAKSRASYMCNFRYSTLELMDKMGFDFGTGSAVPRYKDFNFIVDVPGTKFGRFKLLGLWGTSDIALGYSSEENSDNSYSARGTTTDFGSDLALLALSHTYFLNEKVGFKSNISVQNSGATTTLDSLKNGGAVVMPYYRSRQEELKLAFTTRLTYKPNSKNNFNAGVTLDHYFVNYLDSVNLHEYGQFVNLVNVDDNLHLMKLFGQWQHRFDEKLTSYVGVNLQYFPFNDEVAVEPRASLSYAIGGGSRLTFGYGNHSQIQPKSIYFIETYNPDNQSYRRTNESIKFTRANHYVLGYDKQISKNLRFKAETYYQHLYNIPVKKNFPEFSMLNAGDFFAIPSEDSLVNKGVGTNYGMEFTLEKFLSNGYYFLLTASLFDSKYKGYDDIERNTAFNGNYVVNMLGGYELKVGKSGMVTFDLKSVWAGGRRYVPIDIERSVINRTPEYDWSRAYENRYNDYFRTDLRIGYKMNLKKFSQEWAIDLQNVTGYKSVFTEGFDADKGEIYTVYQQGFMPIFLYRVQF